MLRDARRPRTAGASTPALLPERTLIPSAVFATHTPLHEPLHRATACEYARTNACRPAVGRLVASATLHQLIDLEQPRPHTPPCPDGYSPLTCRAA